MSSSLDFSRFKVITFDCYGTLINWESGILSTIGPILTAHAAKLSDPEILRLYGELEAEAESSEYLSYRDILGAVVSGFGDRLGFRATEEEKHSLANSLGNWRPFADTNAALRKLKPRFELAIISNVDDDLFAATAPQLGVKFDHVITASQARAYKPSLNIFRIAQERIGVSASEWLHAGQSIYHDVVPAKSLRISTAWVNRPSVVPGSGAAKAASAQPDIEVTSLQALADLAT